MKHETIHLSDFNEPSISQSSSEVSAYTGQRACYAVFYKLNCLKDAPQWTKAGCDFVLAAYIGVRAGLLIKLAKERNLQGQINLNVDQVVQDCAVKIRKELLENFDRPRAPFARALEACWGNASSYLFH